jgi:OOP family OmpA-OmpF porin
MPCRSRIVGAIALLAAWLGAAGPARAEDPAARGFDPDTAKPALSLAGGLTVETADRVAPGTRSFGLLLDYAEGLLALRLGAERQQLLRSRLTAHLLAGYALPWGEVGAALPLVLRQRSNLAPLRDRGVTGPLVDGIAGSALGDLRLFAKLPVLVEGDAPLGLAALVDLRLPTGNRKAFAGDGLSAIPGLVITRTLGRVRLDGQLGYLIRGQGQYAQLVVHDGLTGGLGASVGLPGFGPVDHARLMAELLGGWPRGDTGTTDRYRAPLSTRGGVRAFLPRGWAVEAGAGAGLGEPGYGREAWRVFAGVRWTGTMPAPSEEPSPLPPEPPAPAAEPPPPPPPPPHPELSPSSDRDGDGVIDQQDLCPDVPGSPEMDGCPDRDGDFIPDPEDRCPDEPGPAENDGCPVKGPVVELLETQKISLKDSIHFDYDKATIKPESGPVLDSIAALIRDHAELRRIRVEGHTDNRGSAAYNHGLSRRRAASVVRALVQRQIAADRLVPEGYGFDRPVADNRTALGRAKNRRVEFTILEEGQ